MKTAASILLGVSSGILAALALSGAARSRTASGNDPNPQRRRHARDLKDLPRSAALSHLKLSQPWKTFSVSAAFIHGPVMAQTHEVGAENPTPMKFAINCKNAGESSAGVGRH